MSLVDIGQSLSYINQVVVNQDFNRCIQHFQRKILIANMS